VAITFHINDVDFKLTGRQVLKEWLKQVVETEAKSVGNITCIFCSDKYLLSLNKTYLRHNYYTDVITFDYSADDILSGDVFISVDTVRVNAATYKVSFQNEIDRVVLHGVLHLCGYRDETEAERKVMRAKENACLDKLRLAQFGLEK
jgi:rRNA maturation RNase YbeY